MTHDNTRAREQLAARGPCPTEQPGIGDDGVFYLRVEGSPFVRGAGDRDDASMNDVNQGALGDCYLLAACAAVADQTPSVIEGMITQLTDTCFEVTLHLTTDGASSRRPVKVIVDDHFPGRSESRPAYADVGDVVGAGREIWPMLIEKAYAKAMGSYPAIEAGSPGSALEAITGLPAEMVVFDGKDTATIRSAVTAALDSGRPVTACSQPSWGAEAEVVAKELGVVTSHAYAVRSATEARIELYNPWGVRHPSLTWEQFRTLYYRVHLGGTGNV